MGVNGGVEVQPPNQQSALLPDAIMHNNMTAQRCRTQTKETVLKVKIHPVLLET